MPEVWFFRLCGSMCTQGSTPIYLSGCCKSSADLQTKKKYFKITSCKSKMWEYRIYIILKKICQRQDATGFLGAFSDFYHNVFCSSASCGAHLQSIKWSSVMTQNWFMPKYCSSYIFNEVGVLWSLISILRQNTYSYSDELNLTLCEHFVMLDCWAILQFKDSFNVALWLRTN